MAENTRFDDGQYHSSQLIDCMIDSFTSEKDMREFIIQNITYFIKDLGFDYESHVKEFALFPWNRRSKGTKRLDLLVKTKCGNTLIIECKRPKYLCELLSGLGQMMSYIYLFERDKSKKAIYILLSSRLDPLIPEVITKFNLPIKYVVVDKLKLLIWPGQKLN